jgi:DNA invertase Pin-like site-specific DNA recombinase
MKVILYARSKMEGDTEAQQELNRRYAQSLGLTSTIEVTEVANGVALTISPKLSLCLNNLRSQDDYVLICVRPDKLSRRPQVLSQIFFRVCETGGRVLYSGWPNYSDEEQLESRTA